MMEDDPNERVYLNVGGIQFETCRSTLLSTGSKYFERRLQTHTRNDSVLFIDRDPSYFVVILNYLRNKQIIVDHDATRTFLENIKLEAEAYDLDDLQQTLARAVGEKRKNAETDWVNELRQIKQALQHRRRN
jgi:phytoene dehydrogenase-like protein